MRSLGEWDPAKITDRHTAEAHACFDAAFDAGYRTFDSADIYSRGGSERALGSWLANRPGVREQITLASKCGVRFEGDPPGTPQRYDLSPEHITASFKGSLDRLGVAQIDVYFLHRPDLLIHYNDAARALAEAVSSGKIKQVGVSNFDVGQMRAMHAALAKHDVPLAINQIELHMLDAWRWTDGTLDCCQELGVEVWAWAPLAAGKLDGRDHAPRDRDRDDRETPKERVNRAMRRLAKKHDCEPTTIALAALLRHPVGVCPIIGSRTPERIKAATAALQLPLTREDWYELHLAARGKPLA
jgi:aryl-alcohol dehydrogenase-like predicted oxidoreductase